MVVERREAQRARSRRFAQADHPVARATPETWPGGNIRPRGVAHDPAPPGAPLFFGMAFVSVAFGKARTQKMRRENKEACLFRREELWADGQLGRDYIRGMGTTIRECIMGRVSQDCGGNRVDA